MEVTLFTSPLCGPCEELKAELRARGIAFRLRDVLMDEDAGEFLAANGVNTTPALQVGDRLAAITSADELEALFAD